MTKQKIKLGLLALMLTCAATITQAQGGPGDPGDPGGDPDPNGSTRIPFDGGLSLVAAAGIAYVAKKGIEKRKQKKENEKGY
jgi:hypothetical protein